MNQGLIVVIKDNAVVMKIVATDIKQTQAHAVAAKIKSLGKKLSAYEAYAIALDRNFGSVDSLTVVTKEEGILYKGQEVGPWDLYLKTFDQPHFNPRWDKGTADIEEMVVL